MLLKVEGNAVGLISQSAEDDRALENLADIARQDGDVRLEFGALLTTPEGKIFNLVAVTYSEN